MPSLPVYSLALLLALAAAVPASSPAARAGDDDGRQDVTIGNPDRQRSGVNERGDNEMVIESRPQKKQDMPDLGPIYVVPQVNAGRGRSPVVIPVQPGTGQPGQGQPRQNPQQRQRDANESQ